MTGMSTTGAARYDVPASPDIVCDTATFDIAQCEHYLIERIA